MGPAYSVEYSREHKFIVWCIDSTGARVMPAATFNSAREAYLHVTKLSSVRP
jgi:hypothetical protein